MYCNRLKEFRIEKQLLQKDMAKILNLSEISYTHYESEYYIMPMKYLITICDYFSLSLDYLFEFQREPFIQNITKADKIVSSQRLKEFRKDNKLTQNKLASLLNVSQSTIAEYERGTNIIATPFLYTICKEYHIRADYLLGRVNYPKYLN